MLLDWHQLAYLIFGAVAPLTAAGASMLLALLLTTPQSTLSWVPMGCLVPSERAGLAAPAAAVVSSVYPRERRRAAAAAGCCSLLLWRGPL